MSFEVVRPKCPHFPEMQSPSYYNVDSCPDYVASTQTQTDWHTHTHARTHRHTLPHTPKCMQREPWFTIALLPLKAHCVLIEKSCIHCLAVWGGLLVLLQAWLLLLHHEKHSESYQPIMKRQGRSPVTGAYGCRTTHRFVYQTSVISEWFAKKDGSRWGNS